MGFFSKPSVLVNWIWIISERSPDTFSKEPEESLSVEDEAIFRNQRSFKSRDMCPRLKKSPLLFVLCLKTW